MVRARVFGLLAAVLCLFGSGPSFAEAVDPASAETTQASSSGQSPTFSGIHTLTITASARPASRAEGFPPPPSGTTYFQWWPGPPRRYAEDFHWGMENRAAYEAVLPTSTITIDRIPSPQTAGVPFLVYVRRGLDSSGRPFVSEGSVRLFGAYGSAPGASRGEPGGSSFGPRYSPSQVWGVDAVYAATFTVTLFLAEESRRLAVLYEPSSGDVPFITVISNPFDVASGSVERLSVAVPDREAAGAPFLAKVKVRDAYNNPVRGFDGALRFEVIPSADTDLLPADGSALTGEAEVPLTLYSRGPHQIIVRDALRPFLSSSVDTITIEYPFVGDTIVYPSPFLPKEGPLSIRFTVPSASPAKVVVYTHDWVKVREWNFPAGGAGADGLGRLSWDGKDEFGQNMPSGFYYCVTETDSDTHHTKFGLVR
ncbi:MAG: hypothetical protein HY548_00500 [Elusimicrobia bacterium]|nr:hypothetical protein [Elusimicrobiota bacterium]